MTRAARAKKGNWNGTCPEYEAKRVFCRDDVGTTTERVRSANFKVSVKKFYYRAAKGFCEGYKKTFHQIKNFACAQFSYFKSGKQNLDPMQNVKR